MALAGVLSSINAILQQNAGTLARLGGLFLDFELLEVCIAVHFLNPRYALQFHFNLLFVFDAPLAEVTVDEHFGFLLFLLHFLFLFGFFDGILNFFVLLGLLLVTLPLFLLLLSLCFYCALFLELRHAFGPSNQVLLDILFLVLSQLFPLTVDPAV